MDAHGYGKRLIVRSDHKLTAFVEPEWRFAVVAIVLDEQATFLRHSASLNGSESGGGHFSRWFFVSSGPAIAESTLAGKRKEES